MSEELKNAIQESLPENVTPESLPEDVNAASSAEALAEAPASQAEQNKQPPFHEHPRFKEVIDDRNYWKNLAMEAVDKLRQGVHSQVVQSNQSIQEDPYAGMTAEERAFYEKIDRRAEAIADRKIRKAVEEVRPQIEQDLVQTKQTVAGLMYERFQKEHPDIRPGSPEENAIAQMVSKGYGLEESFRIVMFDKVKDEKVAKSQSNQIQKVQQKTAANLENRSIPAVSGLPQKSKVDFRGDLEKRMIEAGL